MRIRLLGSSCHDPGLQYLTSFLVDGRVALDAGSLGWGMSPAEQALVDDVFLSHTHADHLASLPIFLENVYGARPGPVRVHGSSTTLECLHRDVFNGRIWPDFVSMSGPEGPFVELVVLEDGATCRCGDVDVTSVRLSHTVPTVGFVVASEDAVVAVSSDTGPTRGFWERLRTLDRLDAVFLDVAFPDSMYDLARVSGHLTPTLALTEVEKLGRNVRTIAYHVKARYHSLVAAEIDALGEGSIEMVRINEDYVFP